MSKKHVSLAKWKQVLRPYQEEAVRRALAVPQGGKLLLSSPTGTGKGTMELALLKALRKAGKRAWVVTPSIEVLRGYLERCGATAADLDRGAGHLVTLGRKIKVTTPVRMRNMLRGRRVWRGGKRVKSRLLPPDVLIIDEAHHATDTNVCGGGLKKFCPKTTFLGFTATPYRTSAEETGELQKTWGDAHHVLTIPQAVECGAWALPKWRVEPIINDDNCSIVAGDIDADEATLKAAHPLADLVSTLDLSVPTAVTVSTVKAAREVHAALVAKGLDSRLVTAKTPTQDRAEAYAATKAGTAVLLSVRVLGEGVDLPWLRRWVDASPTLSPVSFLQKLGRITRPHASGQPEYVGTNRNLERHGYLLQGTLPRTEFKQVQEKFGGGSRRRAPRNTSIKGVNKLKAIELPLAGGIKGTMWALWHPATLGGSGYERCILIDPTNDRTISAVRTIDTSKEGADRFSKWVLEEAPPAKIVGFRAARLTGLCSKAQLNFWAKEAENRGLDRNHAPLRAQFFALPVLKDVRSAMTPDGRPLRPEPVEAVPTPQEVVAGASQAVIAPDNIPDGYYTVRDGGFGWKDYRVATQAKDDHFAPGQRILSRSRATFGSAPPSWEKVAFVNNGSPRAWARHSQLQGQLSGHWDMIKQDPMTAGRDYFGRTWRCFLCNKTANTSPCASCGKVLTAVDGKLALRPAPPAPVEEPETDVLTPKQRGSIKGHATAQEGNIPLMKRLLTEKKDRNEIEAIYLERYALLGKKNLSWIRARIRTYKKIARRYSMFND